MKVQPRHDGETRRPYVYFAAPLFSQAELAFNEVVVRRLERIVDVYFPQRDGGRLVDLVAGGVSAAEAAKGIFQKDMQALAVCDVLIIVLDGRTVDEGAAFELGVAYGAGKACVGLQTDPRRLLIHGNNPMITGALKENFDTIDSLLDWMRRAREAWLQPAEGVADFHR